jgi:hypothetical protein
VLFVLVLTMISGARELMTPGAWEPNGATHRLANKAAPAEDDEPTEADRKEHLERLKESLWEYARGHGGRFPASQSDEVVLAELWRPPGSGARYLYVGGEASALDGAPLAYEPEVFSGGRWVLFTDGTIRRLTTDELRRALAAGRKP